MKIYKHIPLERESRSLAKHGEGGRMEEFRGFHGGRWKITKWWKNGEEDEDGVERTWRRERKVKVESYVKMRWVVRFMQVGVGLVRVIRS